jgi:probable rRNA maturation factor
VDASLEAGATAPARRRRRSGSRRRSQVAPDAGEVSAELAAPAADDAEEEVTVEADAEEGAQEAAEDQSAEFPRGVVVAVPRGWGRKISAKLVRSVVERALETEGWNQPSTLEVLMLRDDEIREVNATRRGIDEATDVLSFPMLEMKPGGVVAEDFFVLPPDSPVHLGDVLVSVDRVETQAQEAGHSTERELAYLTVHGVLHILGYDHEIEVERRAMRKREEEVLSSLGLRRDAER